METGGVLLGWRASTSEIVITDLVGPGPRAEHHCVWFRPDADWQQEQIDACYAQSGRTVTYLGGWHTHPNGSPVLSGKDLRTLRRISRHGDARIPQPVMAVVAGGPEWRLGVRQPRRPEDGAPSRSPSPRTDRHAQRRFWPSCVPRTSPSQTAPAGPNASTAAGRARLTRGR